jgi:hypothetical protein
VYVSHCSVSFLVRGPWYSTFQEAKNEVEVVIFMEVGKEGIIPGRKVGGGRACGIFCTLLFSPAVSAALGDFRPLNDLCQ